jgi:hypothetical protein
MLALTREKLPPMGNPTVYMAANAKPMAGDRDGGREERTRRQ